MNAFYLYEGQNEIGPFTLDELKQKRITRTTPLRQKDSDQWLPAERISGLKEVVAPRKIRRPKDVVPVVAERVSELHRRKPMALYGTLLGLAMLSSFSFYTLGKGAKNEGVQTVGEAAGFSKTGREATATVAPAPTAKTSANEAAVKPEKSKDDAAKAARLRWNRLISAANSNYGIGFLGGIKDLSVIVTNRSDYPLDEVVTKVTYIKASGDVWKTKLITLYAVQAGDSKEQSVPDVGRGKKVKVSIYKVVSHKMKFSYIEGKRGSDPGDPHYKES